jgi:formate-dependent phosphoribosylglycinamide formyltransferase (GAR transformylase)
LYGEGGIILLFPSAIFSTNSSEFGGYGLFGFEFFMHSKMNYFLEIGGVGSGAVADKVIAKPIYSNVLLINLGFRATL